MFRGKDVSTLDSGDSVIFLSTHLLSQRDGECLFGGRINGMSE